jgi:cell division protease FtsH
MAQPENRPNGNRPSGTPDPNFNWRGIVLFAIAVFLIGGAFVFNKGATLGGAEEVPYPAFVELLKEGKIITDNPQYPVELISTASSANPVIKSFKRTDAKGATAPKPVRTQVNLLFLQDNLYKTLDEYGVKPVQKEDSNFVAGAILSFLPILLFLLILYFLFRQQIRMAGKGALNFGKSKARMLSREKNKITFRDVAGVEECRRSWNSSAIRKNSRSSAAASRRAS